MENKEGYKVQSTTFSQEGQHRLTGQLFHHKSGDAEWDFCINESGTSEMLWRGNLQELIELVLLGKVYKDVLSEIAKGGDTMMIQYLAPFNY